MPRYIVERSFPEGLKIPVNDEGAEICRMIVMINEEFPQMGAKSPQATT